MDRFNSMPLVCSYRRLPTPRLRNQISILRRPHSGLQRHPRFRLSPFRLLELVRAVADFPQICKTNSRQTSKDAPHLVSSRLLAIDTKTNSATGLITANNGPAPPCKNLRWGTKESKFLKPGCTPTPRNSCRFKELICDRGQYTRSLIAPTNIVCLPDDVILTNGSSRDECSAEHING